MSNNVVIEFYGRTVTAPTVEDAKFIIESEYPDAVFAEQWDSGGPGRERLLIWENEEDAGEPGQGDDGSKAIAEIIRTTDRDR